MQNIPKVFKLDINIVYHEIYLEKWWEREMKEKVFLNLIVIPLWISLYYCIITIWMFNVYI